MTGGAGFIGSNIVSGLNSRGLEGILIVDSLGAGDKFKNLRGLKFADFMDKRDFREALRQCDFDGERIDAVFHQGACSDTLNSDGNYMIDNNYRYSVELLEFAIRKGIPFLYASSASIYGSGTRGFREEPQCEFPLNLYAFTKHLFDCHVRRLLPGASSQVVGLRYFNVFGPQEVHKGRMASMAFHGYHQVRSTGVVKLFEGSDGYGPGCQKRDFIFVDDVVKVNMHFFEHPEVSGIFNCGTGKSRTFHDLAGAVIDSAGMGKVEFIPFPEDLKGTYQSFTEADLSRLREAGYKDGFEPLERAVKKYVDVLSEKGGYLFGEGH
ncbi:MAG: ADP-glyceromanno-heptose 6-epimerase [Thermovirgaceae bacterium]